MFREKFKESKSFSEWKAHISDLKSRTRSHSEATKEELKKALIEAVKKRVPKNKFAILFSGGVDSSLIALICKKLGADFICYTVGFRTKGMEPPQDILFAKKVAKSLGIEHVSKEFSLDEVEQFIEKAVRILPIPEIKEDNYIDYMVNVSVASVEIAAGTLIKEKVVFSGLGSEELFAGYDRHERVRSGEHREWAGMGLKDTTDEECWQGLESMWKRDLKREILVSEASKVEVLTPFLDAELIVAAMSIPENRKIDAEFKKIILREIAEELGLEKEFAWRKKQGAQYGSKFDKAITKLSRNKGFELRKRYLESLIEKIKSEKTL